MHERVREEEKRGSAEDDNVPSYTIYSDIFCAEQSESAASDNRGWMAMPVKRLRKECRKRILPVTGRKADLVQRLPEYVVEASQRCINATIVDTSQQCINAAISYDANATEQASSKTPRPNNQESTYSPNTEQAYNNFLKYLAAKNKKQQSQLATRLVEDCSAQVGPSIAQTLFAAAKKK